MKDTKLIGIIAYLIIGLFAAIVLALLFVEVPKSNERILDVLIGALAGYVGAIVTFYWGSSLGSKMKDEKNENQEP